MAIMGNFGVLRWQVADGLRVISICLLVDGCCEICLDLGRVVNRGNVSTGHTNQPPGSQSVSIYSPMDPTNFDSSTSSAVRLSNTAEVGSSV